MSDLPIKAISDIEVKEEVSASDKILILDSDTDEARLASKDELKWDKGDTGEQWPQGIQWPQWIQGIQGVQWEKGDQWIQGIQWPKWETWATITTANFSWNNIVFWKNDWTSVVLTDAKTTLKGDKGDTWASVTSANFSWDDIVFWKDDSTNITLSDAKVELKWDKGDTWNTGATWNGIASITSSKTWKTTTVTITETNGNVDAFQIQDWVDGWGSGDMVRATYDPNGIMADAFDYNNFINAPTVNTKQFILPSLSSLTVAQQIFEYVVWGDGAVIRYNNEDYFLSWFDNGDPIFLRTKLESDTSNDWTNTYMKDTGLKFTIVSYNVTTISVINNTNPWYLATGVNYSTPYTPEYNGSPATKKYVDDSISNLWTASTKDTWTSAWNIPVLDSNGKIPTTTLPWLALTDTFTVADTADLTSLSTAGQWDIAIVTNESKTYCLSGGSYAVLSNWVEIITPTNTVASVNGKTWTVVLDADDISDTTTTNKFVSASEKSTWNWKQDVIQVAILPTASASNVWKIYQYIWATDSTYTNGYFYKSVENSWVYSLENIPVQDGANSLSWLTDTNIQNPQDWQICRFDGITQKWVNSNNTATTSLASLTDTIITTPTNWEFFTYDWTTSKFINNNPFSWNTLTWTSLLLTWIHYRNTISTSSDVTVSVGSGLLPWMEYLLRITNSDTNDHTMTFDSVAYVVPASWTVNFKFLALTTTTMDFIWPRYVSAMPITPDEWYLYYVIQ